jgi:acyl transferase domain-containing protein
MGNYGCLLANGISSFLDLHGPSVTLDTACSGALTAVNMVSLRLLLQWGGAVQAVAVGRSQHPEARAGCNAKKIPGNAARSRLPPLVQTFLMPERLNTCIVLIPCSPSCCCCRCHAQAVESMAYGSCDMALVVAVNALVSPMVTR